MGVFASGIAATAGYMHKRAYEGELWTKATFVAKIASHWETSLKPASELNRLDDSRHQDSH